MTLNYGCERYVRIYTRDTADWLGLSWDAQALYFQILRKVTRAGTLPLGRQGKKAVAIVLHQVALWAERLSPALEELLAGGLVVIDGDTLLIPDFEAAQETPAAGALRTQRWREKQKGATKAKPGDDSSPSGDGERHDVTDGDPVLCRAVPCRTDPCCTKDLAPAAPPPAGAPLLLISEEPQPRKPPSSPKTATKARSEPTPEQQACRRAIREKLERDYQAHKGTPLVWSRPAVANKQIADLATALGDDIAEAEQVIENARARAASSPFWADKWFDPGEMLKQLLALRGEQPKPVTGTGRFPSLPAMRSGGGDPPMLSSAVPTPAETAAAQAKRRVLDEGKKLPPGEIKRLLQVAMGKGVAPAPGAAA